MSTLHRILSSDDVLYTLHKSEVEIFSLHFSKIFITAKGIKCCCHSAGLLVFSKFQVGQATESVSQCARELYKPPLRHKILSSGKNADFISKCCIEIGLVTAIVGHHRYFPNIFSLTFTNLPF